MSATQRTKPATAATIAGLQGHHSTSAFYTSTSLPRDTRTVASKSNQKQAPLPPIERVLAGLSGVKQTGPDKWIAQCPAHDDKRASLSIRDTGDRVLLHCFSGCDMAAVIGALGLTAADLFAERLPGREPRRAPPIPAIDALRILSQEAHVVVIVANDLARGETLTDEVRHRLTTAARRIGNAVEVCHAS